MRIGEWRSKREQMKKKATICVLIPLLSVSAATVRLSIGGRLGVSVRRHFLSSVSSDRLFLSPFSKASRVSRPSPPAFLTQEQQWRWLASSSESASSLQKSNAVDRGERVGSASRGTLESRLHLLHPLARLLLPEAVPLAAVHLTSREPSSRGASPEEEKRGSAIAILLHGLLGNRRNLLSLARGIRSASVWQPSSGESPLVSDVLSCDLRCHGDSGTGPFSLSAAASDVLALCLKTALERIRLFNGEEKYKLIFEKAVRAATAAVPEAGFRGAAICALSTIVSEGKLKFIIVGHSLGGLVAQELSLWTETALRFSGTRPIAGIAVLDIAPSPYWREERRVEVLDCLEKTTISLPSLTPSDPTSHVSSLPSSSSMQGLHCQSPTSATRLASSTCCHDVAAEVSVPSENGFTSERLILALREIPVAFYEDRTEVDQAMTQLEPPLPSSVRQWLLQSLSTLKQRHLQQRQLLLADASNRRLLSSSQQTDLRVLETLGLDQGLPDFAALKHRHFLEKARSDDHQRRQRAAKRPEDGVSELPDSQPLQPASPEELDRAAIALQRKADSNGQEVLSWNFDLDRLVQLAQTNRRKGLAAVPLSVHDPEQQRALCEEDAMKSREVRRCQTELLSLLDEAGRLDKEESSRGSVYAHEAPASHLAFGGPALFVYGGKSPWFVRGLHERAVQRHFPKSKIKRIEKAGHWLHVQQPEATLDAVLAFFRDILQ